MIKAEYLGRCADWGADADATLKAAVNTQLHGVVACVVLESEGARHRHRDGRLVVVRSHQRERGSGDLGEPCKRFDVGILAPRRAGLEGGVLDTIAASLPRNAGGSVLEGAAEGALGISLVELLAASGVATDDRAPTVVGVPSATFDCLAGVGIQVVLGAAPHRGAGDDRALVGASEIHLEFASLVA